VNTPFWSLASELASLPGFVAARAEREGDALTLQMRHVGGGHTVRVVLREGAPRRGELGLGSVALSYSLGALHKDEAQALGLGPWLQRLAQSYPVWRSLLAAGPVDAIVRLDGVADEGALKGFRLATQEPHVVESRRLLDFGEPETEQRVLMELHLGNDGAPARLRARHRTPAPLAVQEALRVATAVALGARSEGDRASGTPQKRSLEVITALDAPQGSEVRLILNGPCEQHCAFCSIPDTFPPSDEGDAELAGHRAVLEARFARGARVLRLTGVDPLASSFVLPLLEHARALGFEEVMINSPCTRLSDRAFAEAIAHTLPARRGVMVPLYGADAHTHDAVVDRIGAHAQVMQALDHLSELLGPRDVQLSTVLVPEVLANIGALVAHARSRQVPLNIYLPFPDADSPFDRFAKVSLPQHAVAARLVEDGSLGIRELLSVRGLAPCVVLAALKDARSTALDEARASLAGAGEVIHDGARTPHQPCAHRERCTLQPPCSGELLTAYVRRHGEAEFIPPSEP